MFYKNLHHAVYEHVKKEKIIYINHLPLYYIKCINPVYLFINKKDELSICYLRDRFITTYISDEVIQNCIKYLGI